jgi:putative ABC transport system permease protein
LNDPQYADTGQLVRVTDAIVNRLGASPGVDAAALVNYLPLSLIRVGVSVTIEGYTPPPGGQLPIARYWVTGLNYFRTAGIPMVLGRDFTVADDATRAGVAIVSETFARRFWNTTEVVGRHLRPEFPQSTRFWIPRARGGPLTIVGVVRDVREDGLPDAAGLPQLYLPYAQNPTIVVTLMARTAGGPAESVASAIREAVRAVDPQLPLSYEMTFDDVLRETFAQPRELAWIIGAFAALALILSAVGVYGMMAYLTTARRHEIGIRMALGATRGDVVSLVVGDAMKLAAVGVAVGVVATPLALKVVAASLYGVDPWSPGMLLAVAALLGTVCACAAAIPGYRAARAGEVVALRSA